MKHDTFTTAYLEAAFWSSTESPFGTCKGCGKDDVVLNRWDHNRKFVCDACSEREPNEEPPLEDNYSITDLSPETLTAMVADCARFQAENDISERSDELAGHDFWLTRNGHGAGFWDGDWEGSGDTLTAASKEYGSFDLYVGDDGRLYSV